MEPDLDAGARAKRAEEIMECIKEIQSGKVAPKKTPRDLANAPVKNPQAKKLKLKKKP
jgi:hypothetical protein